ncbi:transcriptional regulator PadR family protein [[Leptolyngbya] sp. PCC 7376]|uniref:PadR family transcriptional regulator n=1 Tax=[Leptolyngbya] sp. PCC 7376 TaxID=111781 RepID=UPI00029F1F98|nr:PadR family transcriptional regulator [[Leptolyngbya] sp. PCC 7376]AFY40623.1 transcriptional regulator PadR family protein [[Leptolyngbya] sp. PCC 7376]
MIENKPASYEIKKLDEIILRVLQSKELYGLEIIEVVNQASFGHRKINFGSLYPKLRQLERKGLIEGRTKLGATGKGEKQKRYYCLTAFGQKVLNECIEFERRLSASTGIRAASI